MAIAGKVAPTYDGEWSESATYQQHTYVRYNGDCYVSKKPSTGIVPTNEEYWFLALKNVTQEQYNALVNGTTTVGNSASLGGETSKAWQTKLDNIQTTSRGTLSQAGWYRVAEYGPNASVYEMRGIYANGCAINIRKTEENSTAEHVRLLLDSTYGNGQKFSLVSSTPSVSAIKKIRYTYDANKAYIEFYYAVNASNGIFVTVNEAETYNNIKWQAITPTLTEETVDGVTVTTTYDIPANASQVTDLDIKDNILYYELTEGFDLNNAFGTYATSRGNITNSLLNKPSTVTTGDTYIKWLPTLGTAYGMQVLYNSAYSSSEGKYTTTIYIRSYSSSWGSWKQVATTADLANYLPLSGGTVNGNISQTITTADYIKHNLSNSARKLIEQIDPNGVYQLYDDKGQGVILSYADGTNTFHGKATGQGNPVAIQSSAPSDTSALWVDTANKVIKAYIDGAWTQVS